MSALNKAVFLDRDGVLCEDTDYITSFEKLHIYPFAKKAVEQIHKRLPCDRRNKPVRSSKRLSDGRNVTKAECLSSKGDRESDIQTGKAAGTKTVFVKGRKCSEQPDFVVSNVWEFAKSIKG